MQFFRSDSPEGPSFFSYSQYFVWAVFCAALFLSCGRPSSMEFYVRTANRDALGRYEFSLDMVDSLCSYDVDMMIQLGCGDKAFSSFTWVPVTLAWESPSGLDYEETVWVERERISRNSPYLKRFFVPYRRGLVPKEYGRWIVRAQIAPYYVNSYNVLGVGLRLSEK